MNLHTAAYASLVQWQNGGIARLPKLSAILAQLVEQCFRKAEVPSSILGDGFAGR